MQAPYLAYLERRADGVAQGTLTTEQALIVISTKFMTFCDISLDILYKIA
jgi:hypothetical protein